MSIGSLYQYFPNKDGLLVALAEQHVREATAAFGAHLSAMRTAGPPLPDLVRSLVRLAVAQNDSSGLHRVIHAESPRTPALLAALAVLTDLVVDEVAWHLDRAGAGGDDARRRAALVVHAVDAAVHEVVLALPPGPDREAAVEDLISWLVDGLGGPAPPPTPGGGPSA